MTRVVIHGAGGRVGARLLALAGPSEGVMLVGAIVRENSPITGHAVPGHPLLSFAPPAAAPAADVVIDFSSDGGAASAVEVARRTGAALLVGTTALSDDTARALRAAALERAVLVAANTSAGVVAVGDLVERAARLLGPHYTCTIVEAHHAAKKDAPSGTARRRADAASAGGARVPPDQILSVRGGDVVGEHTVRFAGPGEYIEITHRATTRDLFALGALRAARWLHGRGPGWWTMADVVGIRTQGAPEHHP